jgi:hypothetical protein
MVGPNSPQGGKTDELLAELATAAYRAAQRHDFKGAFIDVELDLWSALQAVLNRSVVGSSVENAMGRGYPSIFPVRLP